MIIRPMELVTYDSPFGPGVIILDDAKVKRHLWGRPPAQMLAEAQKLAPDGVEAAMPVDLETALQDYFNGEPTDLGMWAPDTGELSAFAVSVYKAARGLKWGETASYSDIAAAAGRPNAARAVGTALAKNPTPLFVPCHRVTARDGEGGWSGPPGLKRRLLALEGVTRF